jgi:hypothetical protein
MKDTIQIRRVQQSSKDHSLELNLPRSFARLEGLHKGDLLQCKVMNLKNGHNVLLIEKLLTNSVGEI